MKRYMAALILFIGLFAVLFNINEKTNIQYIEQRINDVGGSVKHINLEQKRDLEIYSIEYTDDNGDVKHAKYECDSIKAEFYFIVE